VWYSLLQRIERKLLRITGPKREEVEEKAGDNYVINSFII
jgi:hypothetical protein